jgi:uncharacterized protein (TIGR02246 family)
MNTALHSDTTETEIRETIAAWHRSLQARDLDGMLASYSEEIVLFDVKPPYQIQGIPAVRAMWEACLPYLPEEFEVVTRDLRVFAREDTAIAHWLFRFTGPDMDHPAMQTWMRATLGFARRAGEWRAVHEHVSVPFDPRTGSAAFTLQP